MIKKQTQFNNFCRALRVACVTSLADLPRNEILLSVRLSILHVRWGQLGTAGINVNLISTCLVCVCVCVIV